MNKNIVVHYLYMEALYRPSSLKSKRCTKIPSWLYMEWPNTNQGWLLVAIRENELPEALSVHKITVGILPFSDQF